MEPETDPSRLEVCGLDPAISRETVEIFFESKQKSGGGDLAEDVPIEYLGAGRAVVTFEDEAGTST